MGVLALDNFIDTNAVLVPPHTADTGQSWQRRGGGGFSVITIQGNRARANAAQATFVSVAGLTADYSVEAEINRWQIGLPDGTGALGAGLIVRGGIANVYYEAHYYEQGATIQYRLAVNNNAYTVLSTVNTTQWTTGSRVLKLSVRGTRLTFYVNGTVIFSVTDAVLSTAGLPGLRSFGATGTGSFEYEYLKVLSFGGILPKFAQNTFPLEVILAEPAEDDMQCRQALDRIWAQRASLVNEVVWAYSVRKDYCADWIFLSPGLIVDATATDKVLNTGFGVRVYEVDKVDDDKWIVDTASATKLLGAKRPVWTQPAWYGGYIPWSGRPVNMLIEFYTNGAVVPATGTIIEFSLATYKDTNIG